MAEKQKSLEKVTDTERRLTDGLELFAACLGRHGLELKRGQTNTLQINVGLLCNQVCGHCHLEAGPNRLEIMSKKTIEDVVAYAKRASFQVVDITGGAPEMNPHLGYLIENIAPVSPRLMIRANLTALAKESSESLLGLFTAHRVVIVASFTSLNSSQTDSQRGKGVLEKKRHHVKEAQ